MQNVTREIALDEDEAATGWRGLALLLVVSVAAHAALFGGLGRVGHHASRQAAQAAADGGDGDGGAAAARPHPARGQARAQGRRAQDRGPRPAPPPPDAPPPPPPEAETPADFSGTTLTNDGPGPGWASAVGNGEAMHGPIGRPGAKVTGRAREGAAGPSPAKAGARRRAGVAVAAARPARSERRARAPLSGGGAQARDARPGGAEGAHHARGPGPRPGRRVAERARLRRRLPGDPARIDLDRAAGPRRPAGRDVRQLHLPVRGSMIAAGGLGCRPGMPVADANVEDGQDRQGLPDRADRDRGDRGPVAGGRRAATSCR